MPTRSQMDGWQIATRQDLTGPYRPTTNTNPLEAPPVDTNGFVAGQRATIGDPGAPGLNVVRVSAEVFTSAQTAGDAMQSYVDALSSLGFTDPASAGDLPSPSASMSATNAFIAPQFAMGIAPKAYSFVWRINNLVVLVRAGGDVSITNDQALRWAMLVDSNVPRQ